MQTFIKSSRLATMGIVTGLFLVTGPALAADNTTMAVSATVTEVCDVTATALAFVGYDPLGATDTDATATVSVTCTNGVAAVVQLDDGLNQEALSSAAAPLRRMRSGATTNYLGYQLYTESGYSDVWGGTLATGLAHTGTGLEVDLTVYGRIPMSQNAVAAEDYADTIAVLVVF